MKTIVLYATKYGATREIAERIAAQIDGAIIHDLKSTSPPLTEFDCVLLGSALYAGSIRKEAKAFLAAHASELQGKKVGLFLSGLSAGEAEKAFNSNFPAELLQTARAKELLGGIYDPKQAGAAERFIMKVITKGGAYTDTIDNEKIKVFAETMQA
ncbi:MAG: flavodoxin domain-containing protein [Oscillospiraceae bacterium]|nr:flavodoxin domain-containing protein [Oscillospiraceae bacterium]